MKVLLIHPLDSPLAGAWSRSHWDLVLDLGWAGEAVYAEWEQKLHCPVRSFYGFGKGAEDLGTIAELLKPGVGVLVDEFGLDWWEILAPLRLMEMLELVILERVVPELQGAELIGTRPHALAALLGKAVGQRVLWMEPPKQSAFMHRIGRMRSAASLLSPGQLLQVALDKWDMDFRLRARFLSRAATSANPAVLLPSSYSNVTRMLNAYAKLLPERRFVLVTTRRTGSIPGLASGLAENVQRRSLAGYAPVALSDSTRREANGLEDRWNGMQAGPLRANAELRWAQQNGWFRNLGGSFRGWLRVRDAWRDVLRKERISAVLCGDENNPMNRIPVLLARRARLTTIHCDHGALDGLLALRQPASTRYLVKGEMELDFLRRTTGIRMDQMEQGAPGAVPALRASPDRARSSIVFFSEQHELTHGRTPILYQEILPRLCCVARENGRRVKVKLHPFESATSRRKMISAVLPPADRELVDLVQGALTDELLADTWFAVTVESSVSVDCAIRGIPCFLCRWFIQPLVGYGDQFLKYGAARALKTPDDIARIPEMLRGFEVTPEVQRNLWNPVEAGRLETLLQGS